MDRHGALARLSFYVIPKENNSGPGGAGADMARMGKKTIGEFMMDWQNWNLKPYRKIYYALFVIFLAALWACYMCDNV